jgi:hypothetical protein
VSGTLTGLSVVVNRSAQNVAPTKFGFQLSKALGEETERTKCSRGTRNGAGDLTLDRFDIIFGAAIRNMAVGPRGMLAGWSPAGIEGDGWPRRTNGLLGEGFSQLGQSLRESLRCKAGWNLRIGFRVGRKIGKMNTKLLSNGFVSDQTHRIELEHP